MKRWFLQLETRERIVLAAGGGLAVVIVFWGLVWVPLNDASAALRRSVAEKQALLVDLRRAEAVQSADRDPAQRPASSQSLFVLVDRTARTHGVAGSFTRTRPDGTDAISVSFQNAAFDPILSWLIALERDHAVSVESASFSGSRERGLVTGQLFLRRP